MKKLSKSDMPIEQQKEVERATREQLHRMANRGYAPTAPGAPCTIWIEGVKYRGHYTEDGWEIDSDI